MLSPEKITIELTNSAAFVLWDLECLLEKQLVEILSPDYLRYLKEAREQVRDPE